MPQAINVAIWLFLQLGVLFMGVRVVLGDNVGHGKQTACKTLKALFAARVQACFRARMAWTLFCLPFVLAATERRLPEEGLVLCGRRFSKAHQHNSGLCFDGSTSQCCRLQPERNHK